MFKALGTIDGRELIILGLSRRNRSRLEQGDAIEIDLSFAGIDRVLHIIGGETDLSILKAVQRTTDTENAVIRISPDAERGKGRG